MTLGGGEQSWKTQKISNYCPKRLASPADFVSAQQFLRNVEKTFFLWIRFFHWNNRPPGTQLEILRDFDGYISLFDICLIFCPIFENCPYRGTVTCRNQISRAEVPWRVETKFPEQRDRDVSNQCVKTAAPDRCLQHPTAACSAWPTSVMRFGRTELKRGSSEAKKPSEQFGAVHLSAAPRNPG